MDLLPSDLINIISSYLDYKNAYNLETVGNISINWETVFSYKCRILYLPFKKILQIDKNSENTIGSFCLPNADKRT